MKKVFVIFMSCVLLFSLLLPFGVHAAEYPSAVGEWTLNGDGADVDITSLRAMSVDDLNSVWFTVYYKVNQSYVECRGFSYSAIGGVWSMDFKVYNENTGKTSGVSYKEFSGPITVTNEPTSAMVEWLNNNGVQSEAPPPEPEPMCDGTACSWADDDYNGICDTCGLALMSFRYDLLQYAYDFLNGSFADHTYWVIEQDTVFPSGDITYNIYKSRTPFKYDGGGLYTEGDSYLFGSVMFGSDGVPTSVWWVTVDGETLSMADSPVDVSHDIEGFFPLGLRQMIQQVVESEMTTLIQKVVGPMKILTVCGVGLMACLVVLNLFGKRSLISLKQ